MVEIVHASSQPTLIATPLKRGRSPYKSLFMRLSGLCPSYVAAVQILYNGYHWGEGHGKVAEFCHLLVFCVVRKNDPARRHHFLKLNFSPAYHHRGKTLLFQNGLAEKRMRCWTPIQGIICGFSLQIGFFLQKRMRPCPRTSSIFR